jgi:DNA-binding transcriptional LysR family regulator
VAAAAWLEARVPEARLVLETGSLLVQLAAARAGLGVAVLPCYLADPEPGLVRLLPPIEGLRPELWLVTHEDLRRTARIRAAMEVLGDGIVARAGAFRGERA